MIIISAHCFWQPLTRIEAWALDSLRVSGYPFFYLTGGWGPMIGNGVIVFIMLLLISGLIFIFYAFGKYKIKTVLWKLFNALLGGAIVGGLGFALGFFGPKIFDPGNVEGPILGILVTGPLGFLLGLIGGWVFLGIGIRP
jgi:hypothetical protein